MSKVIFTGFLLLVAFGRLVEMRISRRRQHALSLQGIGKIKDPVFPFMVALHSGVLVSACLEVWLLDRPFILPLALVMGLIFILLNFLRWWVIRTMGAHWNVQVMPTVQLGVVTSGPFRWIRHPNYLAVFAEMLVVPLSHSAWLTALVGTILHMLILYKRISVEESVLLADPEYRRLMGPKPRFIPHWGP